VLSGNDKIKGYKEDWLERVERMEKKECRKRLFGTGQEEIKILVDHADDGIERCRKSGELVTLFRVFYGPCSGRWKNKCLNTSSLLTMY
jgi:hypothetical protein